MVTNELSSAGRAPLSAWPTRAVALDQASAGMVLALDLLDDHGGVLLPRGAVLSDACLASLRRRGVEHCMVRAEAAETVAASPEQRAQRRQQAGARLRHLFRHQQGAEAVLLRLLNDYRGQE